MRTLSAPHETTVPDETPAASYLDGQLLVAMPGMTDERFARAVIYLCAHFRGFPQKLFNTLLLPARDKGFTQPSAAGGCSVGLKKSADFIELKDSEGMCIHGRQLTRRIHKAGLQPVKSCTVAGKGDM